MTMSILEERTRKLLSSDEILPNDAAFHAAHFLPGIGGEENLEDYHDLLQ